MYRVEVNVQTGEQTIIDLTPEEIAELQNQPPPPPYVPPTISDRQFFQQAAISGLITNTEALNAVKTGSIPAALQTIIDGITDSTQKFAAEMLLSGATVFERQHPLTEEIGLSMGWSSQQIDQFFIEASAL